MKSLAALVVLAIVSITGCAGKNGGGTGPVIQRPVDDGGHRDHDPTAPVFGQR